MLNENTGEMLLRRWDSSYEPRALPKQAEALKLLSEIEQRPPPQGPDVILHLLQAFRILRSAMVPGEAIEAIRVFNALLMGAEAVRARTVDENEWLACRTIGDALNIVNENVPPNMATQGIRRTTLDKDLGVVLSRFVRPEPENQLTLELDLLLRHAAGQLYQAAHLTIERESQLAFAGLAKGDKRRGILPRDVRFTPVTLARALVQQAFRASEGEILRREHLDILDPACGSGVFLQEVLHELQRRDYRGSVTLRGFDISEISCEIAGFCLQRAKRDAEASGIEVMVDIRKTDALQEPWGTPDVILMNPPFVSWQTMASQDRSMVEQVLGELSQKRPDKAMAFAWKAAESLRAGGILASVLPAPLFETMSGQRWRKALQERLELHLLGRFRGYGFFRESLVEPGFVVLKSPAEDSTQRSQFTKVLVAGEGFGDAAIRALRRYNDFGQRASEKGCEVFEVPADTVSSASWLPRSGESRQLAKKLSEMGLPTVRDLFHVHQGIKTGRNAVFVLSKLDVQYLPREERKFFRPVATSPTIEDGRILSGTYVFYPYDSDGLLLKTEADLKSSVPDYYKRRLLPAKDSLQSRSRVKEQQWWALTLERAWQRSKRPKLVTKSFGERGSFAYDNTGKSVVLQGYAWLWKAEASAGTNPNEVSVSFHDSSLPWAYLALLNSPFFEGILDCYCPRVQGGQFYLSAQFVGQAFLPDLADRAHVSGDVVEELAVLGRRIHTAEMEVSELPRDLAASAYGLPPSDVQ